MAKVHLKLYTHVKYGRTWCGKDEKPDMKTSEELRKVTCEVCRASYRRHNR
jgi:hypothetical protein